MYIKTATSCTSCWNIYSCDSCSLSKAAVYSGADDITAVYSGADEITAEAAAAKNTKYSSGSCSQRVQQWQLQTKVQIQTPYDAVKSTPAAKSTAAEITAVEAAAKITNYSCGSCSQRVQLCQLQTKVQIQTPYYALKSTVAAKSTAAKITAVVAAA